MSLALGHAASLGLVLEESVHGHARSGLDHWVAKENPNLEGHQYRPDPPVQT